MGFFSFVALSAAGIWSARAIARLNAKIPRIRVPASSPLTQYAEIRGDIYADTFVVELPKRVAYSNVPVEVHHFARAFFTSQAFTGLEKPLLKLAFSLKEPQVRYSQFDEREQVLLWTVTDRQLDDILLAWENGGFRGLTWFHVTHDRRYLMFGSSIGYGKADKNRIRLHTDVSPTWLLYKALNDFKDNPYELPLLRRLAEAASKVGAVGAIGVHQFYSRLLLASTLKKLVLEEP